MHGSDLFQGYSRRLTPDIRCPERGMMMATPFETEKNRLCTLVLSKKHAAFDAKN